MTIGLIWASDRNGAIGRDNEIPWRIPEDQKRFRELTVGHPVIMGRRTWESLPVRFRPLPGRHNIVLTRDLKFSGEGATTVTDLTSALKAAEAEDDTVSVIGGAQVYAAAMPYADVLHVTEVDVDSADCDTFAPPIDPAHWQAETSDWLSTEDGVRFRFVDYRRIGR